MVGGAGGGDMAVRVEQVSVGTKAYCRRRVRQAGRALQSRRPTLNLEFVAQKTGSFCGMSFWRQ